MNYAYYARIAPLVAAAITQDSAVSPTTIEELATALNAEIVRHGETGWFSRNGGYALWNLGERVNHDDPLTPEWKASLLARWVEYWSKATPPRD